MIPPSLARLIEKWREQHQPWNAATSSSAYKNCADELSAALQSMTAEEPVATIKVGDVGQVYLTWHKLPSEVGSCDLYAHPPLVAAKEIEGAAAEVLPNHFVQPVPNHCDRILWKGRYYHLPLSAHPQPLVDAEAAAREILTHYHVRSIGPDAGKRNVPFSEIAAIIRKHLGCAE